MQTPGRQLVPEHLLKLSDTLYIQYRYIEHVHEEMSCKKNYFLAKWLLILYVHMRGIQLVPQLVPKQFNTLLTQYRLIEHLLEEV